MIAADRLNIGAGRGDALPTALRFRKRPGATARSQKRWPKARRHSLPLLKSARSHRIESKDAVPVVLHADHDPALALRLVIERLGEGADL